MARRSLDAQRALTGAALARDDVAALLDALAEQVGGGAATVGRDGEVLERVGTVDVDALLREEVLRIRDRAARGGQRHRVARGPRSCSRSGSAPGPRCGWGCHCPGRQSEVHRVAIATAVSLLGLALERRRTDGDRTTAAGAGARPGADRGRADGRVLLDATAAAAGARPLRPRSAEAIDDALVVLEGRACSPASSGTSSGPRCSAARGGRGRAPSPSAG